MLILQCLAKGILVRIFYKDNKESDKDNGKK